MGLSLNLFGGAIAEIFDLPFYFDTSGTIFIAALGSYMPGIAVGFLTNLLKSISEPYQMYFSVISIFIAIFTTFMARQGFFNKFSKALILIPALTFFVGGFSILIEKILYSASFLTSASVLDLDFAENFWNEFIDKAFSILLAFLLLKITPQHVKDSFLTFGHQQATLSEEMRRAVADENYLSSSLRNKLLSILMLSSFFVSFSIAFISLLLFKDAALSDRIKNVDSIDAIIINEINPARVDKYIELGSEAEGYTQTREKLYAIKNSNTSIKYLYVYRFSEEGCRVVFDLNAADLEGDRPGELIDFDSAVLKYKGDLIAGRPIPPIISDDEYGYLLTLYKPLYDIRGKCQCYAAVDFSLDSLTEYARGFIIKLIILFAGCFVFIFVLGLWFTENHIILPLNTMAYCARNCSFDNAASRKKYMQRLMSLKIKTGDEIENLYTALIWSAENLVKYLKRLQIAKVEVANMRELANTDSLTGIKNKTAYTAAIGELDKKILKRSACFCVVMIDVNFLKRVNDTYGHERGNEYLINSCRLICSIFGADHVYRIGGDEFVVLVEGEKVTLCKYFVSQFKAEMDRKNSNPFLSAWERISAAVGIAFYEPAVDKNADDVFKRADKEMYENKLAMKAQRKD